MAATTRNAREETEENRSPKRHCTFDTCWSIATVVLCRSCITFLTDTLRKTSDIERRWHGRLAHKLRMIEANLARLT